MSKRTLIGDCEVYRDYFLLGLMNAETKNVRAFEMFDGQPFDRDTVQKIVGQYRIVGFNWAHYDLVILTAALRGADPAKLKEISDKIILNNLKPWHLGIEPIKHDFIDLIEVAPGIASLKIYGGRLHAPKMQDLPIEPDASISPEQRETLRLYNGNDLGTTDLLFDFLKPQIELREQMSDVYGIDLRSKSDAQIAEAVISKQVGIALGETVKKPEINGTIRFHYQPPAFLKFTTPVMQDLLAMIERVEFFVPDSGAVEMPAQLDKAVVRIGGGAYRLGIGGLHSSEKSVSHYSDEEFEQTDTDVVSYYPAIILRTGLAPEHMGSAFTRAYSELVEQRIKAKRSGNKVAADSLKIVVNGSFGKFGSKWSKLYSPRLLIQTTVTGQLALLMLIERLEDAGIEVISANTDGVGIRCHRSMTAKRDSVIAEWERDTGFETETVAYRNLHSRDVNNYLGIKPDGSLKLKGAYAPAGLQKNPVNEVCIQAAIWFLRDDKPIDQTVLECTDIRKFVTIRQVKGGALDQDGAYLGKAVRWYYARGVEGPLRYKVNGYTVARSEGAKALMELPESLPVDVDTDWYIRESRSILSDVGVDPAVYPLRGLI